MSSLAFCVKVRTFFLPKGRNLLTSLKLRPTIRPFLVENVSREVRVNSVVLRQIHVKPSDCKFTPQHSWDRVASEFTLVYETSLKNWIWGFYFCQMLVVPMYLWMLGYKLPRSLEEMPADSIGLSRGPFPLMLTILFMVMGNVSEKSVAKVISAIV